MFMPTLPLDRGRGMGWRAWWHRVSAWWTARRRAQRAMDARLAALDARCDRVQD